MSVGEFPSTGMARSLTFRSSNGTMPSPIRSPQTASARADLGCGLTAGPCAPRSASRVGHDCLVGIDGGEVLGRARPGPDAAQLLERDAGQHGGHAIHGDQDALPRQFGVGSGFGAQPQVGLALHRFRLRARAVQCGQDCIDCFRLHAASGFESPRAAGRLRRRCCRGLDSRRFRHLGRRGLDGRRISALGLCVDRGLCQLRGLRVGATVERFTPFADDRRRRSRRPGSRPGVMSTSG